MNTKSHVDTFKENLDSLRTLTCQVWPQIRHYRKYEQTYFWLSFSLCFLLLVTLLFLRRAYDLPEHLFDHQLTLPIGALFVSSPYLLFLVWFQKKWTIERNHAFKEPSQEAIDALSKYLPVDQSEYAYLKHSLRFGRSSVYEILQFYDREEKLLFCPNRKLR